MRRGYMRLGPMCPSEEEQTALLRRAGIADFSAQGPVYVDRAPEKRLPAGEKPALRSRRALTQATREGDEVVVSHEGIIGLDDGDTMFALAELAEKGGVFVVAGSGVRITFHPSAAAAIDAAKAGRSQRDTWRMAYARKAATTHRKGGRRLLTGKRRQEAEAAWRDPTKSANEVAKEYDVSVSTLTREFGARGTPIFGTKRRTR